MRSITAKAFGADSDWSVGLIVRMARPVDLTEVVTISQDTSSLAFQLKKLGCSPSSDPQAVIINGLRNNAAVDICLPALETAIAIPEFGYYA